MTSRPAISGTAAAGAGGADAGDDLQVGRPAADRAEHGDPGDQRDRARDTEGPVAEQPQRDDRVGGCRAETSQAAPNAAAAAPRPVITGQVQA